MSEQRQWAVYHRVCGHVLSVHSRNNVSHELNALIAGARDSRDLRRRPATPEDADSVARDERCRICLPPTIGGRAA